MARFKTFVAIIRPFAEEGSEIDILGVFSNHKKAENAILNYYRRRSHDFRGILKIKQENDLVANIRYRDGGEENFKGSVLKFFVE